MPGREIRNGGGCAGGIGSSGGGGLIILLICLFNFSGIFVKDLLDFYLKGKIKTTPSENLIIAKDLD